MLGNHGWNLLLLWPGDNWRLFPRHVAVQGDIATCAGTYLHVWSVNGDELASINTATSRNQQILCVAMSQMMEWSQNNVIMTGNSDGVVRVTALRPLIRLRK